MFIQIKKFLIYYLYTKNAYKILSRICRIFNENYPHLPPMTKGKFRRIEANFLRFGQIGQVSNRPKTVVGNEEGGLNTLVYFEANSNASVRAAE